MTTSSSSSLPQPQSLDSDDVELFLLPCRGSATATTRESARPLSIYPARLAAASALHDCVCSTLQLPRNPMPRESIVCIYGSGGGDGEGGGK
jgi:hypothetical protein